MNPISVVNRRDLLRTAVASVGVAALGATAQSADAPKAKAALPQVKPEEIGIDPKRLQVAYDLLEKWTTGPNAPVPGAAMLVGRSGKTVAPRLFETLGICTVLIGDKPDGRNINLRCGSTHPETLAAQVVSRGCQLGVAFDGDGDRPIFVDHTGAVVNGDAILLMCAKQLRREGRLKGDAIVGRARH